MLTDLITGQSGTPTQAPAHVEARLTDGVLTITGTDHCDDISVQQVNGKLSIKGAKINVDGRLVNSVDASVVKGIWIDGNGGNDRITVLERGIGRQAINIDATITGGAGNDTITSGSGNDWIRGGHGNDVIRAGRGDDEVYGEYDNDALDGGDGNDRLYGDSVVEWVGGETPNIYEPTGNDLLCGSNGNDVLTGGLGNDKMDGGVGEDRIAEVGNVDFALSSSRLTGVGRDSISNIELADLHGGDSANRIDAHGFRGDVILEGRGGNDTLIGGTGNDLLIGGWCGDEVLVGDVIFDTQFFEQSFGVRDGDDSLDGRAGNDEMRGGFGNDKLNGGAGDDFLSGGVGDDQLSGGIGNDTLSADPGNDSTDGGFGNDSLSIKGYDVATLSDKLLDDGIQYIVQPAPGQELGLGVDHLNRIERVTVNNGSVADASGFTGQLEVHSEADQNGI